MATTNTGTDNIDLAPENDDFEDATGQGNANVPAAPAAVGANRPTNFNLRVEQNKTLEFFGAKSKDTISADDWRIWPKQTDGRTPRPTTTSPTLSGTRHGSGFHP